MEDTSPGLTVIPSEGKGKGKERTPAQKEAIQKALARLAEKRKLKGSEPVQVTQAPKDAPPVIKAKRVYKKRTAPAPSAPSAPSVFPTLPTIGAPSLPAPPPIASPGPPGPDYMGELQQLRQMIGAMANGGREIVRSTKAPKKRIVVVDDSSSEEEEEEIVVRRKKSPKAPTAVAPAPAPAAPAPPAPAPPAKKYCLDPALFSRY